LSETELQEKASKHGLKGEAFNNVASAYKAAKNNADKDDLIFIGGSTFVVADFLSDFF
jgi:dihydrofolate synthase/folylpolyglutamate synthase